MNRTDAWGDVALPDSPMPPALAVADPVALCRDLIAGRTPEHAHHDDALALVDWMRGAGKEVPPIIGLDWLPWGTHPYYRLLHELDPVTEAAVFRAALARREIDRRIDEARIEVDEWGRGMEVRLGLGNPGDRMGMDAYNVAAHDASALVATERAHERADRRGK